VLFSNIVIVTGSLWYIRTGKKNTMEVTLVTREKGFSLLELLIVCVVLVILSTLAVPNIMQINANYKLDAAGHSMSSLLQQARMQAVKSNQPAYAKYDSTTNIAFVTNDPGNAYASGNPDVALSSGLSFQTAPPDHSQLDAYVGGASPQILPVIGFNARGLPCIGNVANASVCPNVTSGFEWFVQNSRLGGWEAITVTPAGRIKSWRLTKQTGGTAACGYTACWQ
jgi:prepilin-type N-terminal cleavage/methylation domain-containing protein